MEPLAIGTSDGIIEEVLVYEDKANVVFGRTNSPGMVEGVETSNDGHTTRMLDFIEPDVCDDSNNNGIPKIEMIFETENIAYDFYNDYGRRMGFSIRRGQNRKRASGVIQMKRFLCSNEGFCNAPTNPIMRKKKRELERTGCKARLDIKRRTNGKYYVDAFEPQHNHLLVSPRKVHLLRSQRCVTEVQAEEADSLDKAGIKPKNAYTYMQKMAGGRQSLGYLPIDHRNHLRGKRKRALEKEVEGSILDYFSLMQVKDPGFFYAFQVDEDDLLTNIFWADSCMRRDYEAFGDVVCFDTTFATNNECRPFAPFVGVNHHKQTIIFEACFLYDETADSFMCVFNTFVTAMSGKEPRTILTDQDKAMAKAIASTLPKTIHRLCVWHMYQNAAKNLTNIFNTAEGFKKDFGACVFDFDDEEDFLQAWENMLEKYNLRDNEWLKKLYKEKEKWALVYGRDTFCADMKSTQISEIMNRMVKDYVHITYDLMRFFDHFQRMLDDLRNNELERDFRSLKSAMSLYLPVEKLKVASKFYTRAVFEVFEKELMKTHNLVMDNIVEDDRVAKYSIENIMTNHKHSILFNLEDNIAKCGCQKFEFEGIICCHLLKVYERRDIKQIPSHYFLKRWSKDAKFGIDIVMPPFEEDEKTTDNAGMRYHLLTRKAIKVSARAAESKETFLYLDQIMDQVLQDVDNRLRKLRIEEQCSNTLASQGVCQKSGDDVSGSHSQDYGNVQTVRGFKQTKVKKRGAKRKLSCLERCKKKKISQEDNIVQTPHVISYRANPSCPITSQEHSSFPYVESIGSRSQLSQPQVQSPSEMQKQIENLTTLVLDMQKNSYAPHIINNFNRCGEQLLSYLEVISYKIDAFFAVMGFTSS